LLIKDIGEEFLTLKEDMTNNGNAIWEKFDRVEPHQNVMIKIIEALEVNVDNEEGRRGGSTDLDLSIQELFFKVQMMSSRLSSASMMYDTSVLQSFEDAFLFVDEKVENVSYGCFVYMLALLDTICDSFTYLRNQQTQCSRRCLGGVY